MSLEPVFLSCAVTGGMSVPGQSKAIPITPEEIVESAVEASEAGAAIGGELATLDAPAERLLRVDAAHPAVVALDHRPAHAAEHRSSPGRWAGPSRSPRKPGLKP